jgi:hypothetical protein
MSPQWKRFLILFGILSVLAAAALALRFGGGASTEPAPAAGNGAPPHPYLHLAPKDLGVVAPSKPPAGLNPVPLFNMWLPMPLDFEEVLYLDECPMRRLGFAWNRRRRVLIYSPMDPKWTYEEFQAIFNTVPSENPSDGDKDRLYLKSHLLPADKGDIFLHVFQGTTLKGFMVDPSEPQINSRDGHTTTYYLFPMDGAPGIKIEVFERRDTFERPDSPVHTVVAAVLYPAPKDTPDDRMRSAIHSLEHDDKVDALLGFLAAHCAYPRETLESILRVSLELKRPEIARFAFRLMEEKNMVPEDRTRLLEELSRLDQAGGK